MNAVLLSTHLTAFALILIQSQIIYLYIIGGVTEPVQNHQLCHCSRAPGTWPGNHSSRHFVTADSPCTRSVTWKCRWNYVPESQTEMEQ